jgi:dodecin
MTASPADSKEVMLAPWCAVICALAHMARIFPTFVCQRTDPCRQQVQADRTIPTSRGKNMTVARITEISSVSAESFQHAILQGVERANKTLKNVKGAWVKDQEVTIDKGKVTGYKVILKVTFILSD